VNAAKEEFFFLFFSTSTLQLQGMHQAKVWLVSKYKGEIRDQKTRRFCRDQAEITKVKSFFVPMPPRRPCTGGTSRARQQQHPAAAAAKHRKNRAMAGTSSNLEGAGRTNRPGCKTRGQTGSLRNWY
jgi:hypothetical protein